MIDPHPLSGLRVLLVDDDREIRCEIAEALREEGADVVTARSGAEALAQFAGAPAHVVVTDIAMPEFNGCALLRAVRRRYPDPVSATPVVALCGMGIDVAAAEVAGFDAALPKPVDAAVLVSALARFAPATRPPR